MNIVYFMPDIEGGVARVVRNLLRYRPLGTGIIYKVVLYGSSSDMYTRVGNDLKADAIIRFNYEPEENAWSVFRRLSKVIDTEKDIIVGNDGFEIKMVAALKLKNPVVYILHGDFDYYYTIVKNYQGVINYCIAISNTIELKLQSIIRDRDYCTISKLYFPSAAVSNSTIIPRTNNIFLILFAGMLNERKGADMIPGIYNYLIENGVKNFQLEVIGDGDWVEKLNDTFVNAHEVVLSGWQPYEYVQQQLKTASVFLFPSRVEGLPNVLLEALSAGAVPVASKLSSGVLDIIQHEVNGLLVEPGNAALFGEAIVELFNNKDKLQKLQTNTHNNLERFEPYQQALKYEQIIFSAVSANSTGKERIHPRYVKGRVLDIEWLPGFVVILLRKLFRIPEF